MKSHYYAVKKVFNNLVKVQVLSEITNHRYRHFLILMSIVNYANKLKLISRRKQQRSARCLTLGRPSMLKKFEST